MDYEKLIEVMETEQDEALRSGDFNASDYLDEAMRVLRGWIDAGAPPPLPEAVEKFVYLLEDEVIVGSTDLEEEEELSRDEPEEKSQLESDIQEAEPADDVREETESEDDLPDEFFAGVEGVQEELIDSSEVEIDLDESEEQTAEEELLREIEIEEQEAPVDIENKLPTPAEGEAVEDLDDAQPSLEMQNLKNRLEEAKQALASGLQNDPAALTRSITLANHLINAPVPEIASEAREVLARANNERNQIITDALDKADQASAQSDWETARTYYQMVVDIDETSEHAQHGLEKVRLGAVGKIEQKEVNKLRSDLKSTRDIRRLADAVYRAEAWEAEDRLPPDLIKLLAKARAAMDEQRITMGQQTTMMRFGDLQARRQARDGIEERVSKGDRYIFDATTNQNRPATEVLEIANQLYKEASTDTAQYLEDRIRGEQERYPIYALRRLENALGKQPKLDPVTKEPLLDKGGQPLEEDVYPFFEEHRRNLSNLLSEVSAAVSRQEEAERLVSEADNPKISSLERLILLLKAQQYFRHIIALQEQIDLARNQAILDLERQMDRELNEAEIHLAAEDFKQAEAAIANALAVPLTWQRVEKETPAELIARSGEAESLRQEIAHNRTLLAEYNAHAKRVRELVRDPETRRQGLIHFDDTVRSNEDYQRFTDYSFLRNELEEYRDVGENLTQARLEARQKNWTEVIRLCGIMSKRATGELKSEVDALLDNALFEKTILDVKEFIRGDDITSADTAFDKIKTDPGRGQEAQDRLKVEAAIIEKAKEDSGPMQDLFVRAEAMAKRNNVGDKMRALLMFRFIAGQVEEKPYPNWPDYKLSLVTSIAAGKAVELREELRAQLLPGVMETAKALEEGRTVQVQELGTRTHVARALRNADLLDREEERSAAREILLEQGRRDALEKEQLGNWDEAVEIWSELDKHYPRQVNQKLHRARINQLLAQTDSLLRQDNAQAALELLDRAQEEGDLARVPQLELKRADVYAALSDYNRVFLALDIAQRHGADLVEINDRRDYFERERAIRLALEKADLERVHDPIEALVTLKNALSDELTAGSRRLQRLRDDIFNEARDAKMTQARDYVERGTVEGKIEAVVALVDLSELEELAGVPEEMRRADRELDPLREQLKPGAEQVIEEAESFRPRLSLQESLRQAMELRGRLETFSKVIHLFAKELAGMEDDLVRNQEEIGRYLVNLRNLQDLLEDANEIDYWTAALQRDNFEPLVLKQNQIRELRLDQLSEVNAFNEKLAEWQDLHAYLRTVISRVKRDFNREEVLDNATGQTKDLFLEIRNELNQLEVRPDIIYVEDPYTPNRQNPRSLLHVQNSEYQHIRRIMGPKLIVNTVDGTQLSGWDEVKEGASERAHESALWLAWAEACRPALRELELAVQNLQSQGGEDKPFNVQRGHWLIVQSKAESVLEMLSSPPEEDGIPVPVRSDRVTRVKASADRQIATAQEWQLEARLFNEQEMMQFPSATEFSDLAKTVEPLRRLIERAEEIGPTPKEVDPDLHKAEIERIATYKRILQKNIQKRDQPKGGLFGKIFGR